jgi:hypothetical protein
MFLHGIIFKWTASFGTVLYLFWHVFITCC